MLKLVEKGYTREEAYKIVQKHALNALDGGSFKQGLLDDDSVTSKLSKDEFESCFDINDYLKNIDKVFARYS